MILSVKAVLVLVMSALAGPALAADFGRSSDREVEKPLVDPVIDRERSSWTNRWRPVARPPHVLARPTIKGDKMRRAYQEGTR